MWEQNHPFGGSLKLRWVGQSRRYFVTLEATEYMGQVSMSSSTFGGTHTALGVCIRDFVETSPRETSLRWN